MRTEFLATTDVERIALLQAGG